MGSFVCRWVLEGCGCSIGGFHLCLDLGVFFPALDCCECFFYLVGKVDEPTRAFARCVTASSVWWNDIWLPVALVWYLGSVVVQEVVALGASRIFIERLKLLLRCFEAQDVVVRLVVQKSKIPVPS